MKVKDIISNNSVWMPNKRYGEVRPLISVLLPTYSRARSGLLKRCLDSVLNQSFRRLELLIVIDASTDGTYQICKHYMERDPRVNIILHRENIALPAISTYEAYMKARGEYIAYAFDDNIWDLNALAKTFDYMEENGVKASYGITRVRDPDTGAMAEFGANQKWINDTIWMGNQIGAGSVVLRREVLETVGLHDPHLSLTRVCDWDLWLRVCERYPFVGTGILFTEQYGVSQPDSLGNAFKIDQWFFRERQQHRRLGNLLPENYLEIDCTEYTNNSSRHFLNCLVDHLNQYRKKTWFCEQEIRQIKNQKPQSGHQYILLACADKTASVMNIERCASESLTFCYAYFPSVLHSLLVFADAVVMVRGLEMVGIDQLSKLLDIPCYYFTDDNFREILVDGADEPGIREVVAKTTKKGLEGFAGILVTTPALRDYFVRNKLHTNVIQIPAVWKESLKKNMGERAFTVGFMGGPFRTKELKKCVLPALYKLAERRRIRLILPCTIDTEDDVLALSKGKLEIIPFFRTSNYEYSLNSYNEIGVDIFVHCGGNLRNNIYKTKNALINAVTLGAPLIVSDIEPYCDTADGSEGAYLIVRNTPEAWQEGLARLMESKSLRERLLRKARVFCEHIYNWETAWAELSNELSQYEPHDDFFYLKRYEKLCDWLVRRSGSGLAAASPLPAGFRVYNPDKLSFSGELNGVRRYGFTATKTKISEIGLLFAIFGECSGEIHLTIRRRKSNDALSEKNVPIDLLKRDAYTNIYLENTIEAKIGELLYLDIAVRYDDPNGYIGVFEDCDRRTFFYKVFNKLGHPIPGRDALFIDCRS